MESSPALLLSVIVTIIEAGTSLERCLQALRVQQHPPAMEVIVPWDSSVPGVSDLIPRFPTFHFVSLGALATDHPADAAAGQHELYDRRRSAGLAAATGDVVAVLEDRGVPRSDWARNMAELHQRLPHAAIGGAIENGRQSLWAWAVYFCDFGRFGRPFEAGPRRWVSDTNIGYKRRALEQTRALWRDRYHETTVHWALLRAGEILYVSPEPVVDQMRDPMGWRAHLSERFAWGRLFAVTRAREATGLTRAARVLSSPLLPAVLFARQAAIQVPRRARTFAAAAPIMILLLLAWCAGEAVGYATGRN